MRLRIKRKFRDSDKEHHSSTCCCSTKKCRHISSSLEEDTEDDDDVNDDDRLIAKVKHNEYADPPLEDPLKTLNMVVTSSTGKSLIWRQTLKSETVSQSESSGLGIYEMHPDRGSQIAGY